MCLIDDIRHQETKYWLDKKGASYLDPIHRLREYVDTREVVIAKVEDRLAVAKKEQARHTEGSLPYYWEGVVIAELEVVLTFIRNPKEAIPTPQPNPNADNPSSRKP